MMKITNYPQATDFLAKAQTYLAADELVNGVMLGVITRLAKFPERYPNPPYLATVEDEGRLIMVATMTPPFNLLLASYETEYRQALELVADNLLENGWKIPGVITTSDRALAFAEIWQKKSGQSYRLAVNERLFKLTEVIMPPLPPGHFRIAGEGDIEKIAEWIQAFELEALGKVEVENPLEVARNRIKDGDFFVWEDEGQLVSMAAKSRPTANGISVGAVYTPPEGRGKGYASACVAKLSQHLLDSGFKFCNLFTDLANPVSNSIYQKMGYQPVADFNLYRFA